MQEEQWVTLHASTVKVITPYENVLTIMHEGASGGGKSEMAEQIHKDSEGNILLATNLVTGDKSYIDISASCELKPVTDDMAMCHPSLQNDSKKLVVTDGEEGYDKGAAILSNFFKEELRKYLTPDLHPLGKEIIECCLRDGSLEEYVDLISIKY